MPETVPVIYIAGTGRSGSTLLGNILGSLPGAFSAGEVRQVWDRGLRQDWDCGCGARFSGCPFWQEALRAAFPHGIDVDRLLASDRALLRLRASRRAPRWSMDTSSVLHAHGYYLDALSRLYTAMQQVSKELILVDTSKSPSYAALLAATARIDLRVLHLVRDPRAAAHSWTRPKASPDRRGAANMDRLGAAKSAALWVMWNGSVESFLKANPGLPRFQLCYEDFMAEPAESLRRALDRLAPELATAGFPLSGRDLVLSPSHTVSGNADRMRSGEVSLQPDDRWREGLGTRQRLAVTAIGGLRMRRYGYEWRLHG